MYHLYTHSFNVKCNWSIRQLPSSPSPPRCPSTSRASSPSSPYFAPFLHPPANLHPSFSQWPSLSASWVYSSKKLWHKSNIPCTASGTRWSGKSRDPWWLPGAQYARWRQSNGRSSTRSVLYTRMEGSTSHWLQSQTIHLHARWSVGQSLLNKEWLLK